MESILKACVGSKFQTISILTQCFVNAIGSFPIRFQFGAIQLAFETALEFNQIPRLECSRTVVLGLACLFAGALYQQVSYGVWRLVVDGM